MKVYNEKKLSDRTLRAKISSDIQDVLFVRSQRIGGRWVVALVSSHILPTGNFPFDPSSSAFNSDFKVCERYFSVQRMRADGARRVVGIASGRYPSSKLSKRAFAEIRKPLITFFCVSSTACLGLPGPFSRGKKNQLQFSRLFF